MFDAASNVSYVTSIQIKPKPGTNLNQLAIACSSHFLGGVALIKRFFYASISVVHMVSLLSRWMMHCGHKFTVTRSALSCLFFPTHVATLR